MAVSCTKFLDVVVEIDAFAHGQEEFTLKCLAISCRQLRYEKQEHFSSDWLQHSSPTHLLTYSFQTRLHGFAIHSPGAPQPQAPLVMRQALCEIQRNYITLWNLPAPPIRVWAKGHQKSNFVRTLLPLYMDVANLEEVGCPPINKLPANSWVTTMSKARSLGQWLATNLNN